MKEKKLIFHKEDLDNNFFQDGKYYQETLNLMLEQVQKFRDNYWNTTVKKLEGLSGREYGSWGVEIDIDCGTVTFTGENENKKPIIDDNETIDSIAMALSGMLTDVNTNSIIENYFRTVDCEACNENGMCPIQELAKKKGVDYKEIQK